MPCVSSTRAAQEVRAAFGSGRASLRERGSGLSGVDAVCTSRPGTYRCREIALWSANEAGPIVDCIDRRSIRSVGSCRAKWSIEDKFFGRPLKSNLVDKFLMKFKFLNQLSIPLF